ncbi:MAG TPA: hypothetical protein V6D14_24475 [Coleofasciculaceae cyanobacterium]|jgi:hypothetical protein
MQCFEYLTVYINSLGAYQTADGTWRSIQELGDRGWELVSVANNLGDLVAFFKRPKD